MFPPKKKPAIGVTVAVGGGKPPMKGGMGGEKPSFGGSKPAPHSPEDLEGPDPVEGKMDDEPDTEDSMDDSGAPDMTAGQGYGAKLEKDIESVGAALGMDAGQAKKAAGAFFMTAAQCLMGGDEGDQDTGGSDGDEMIDTEGGAGPGRYGQ